jgi:hypothetical protein
MNTMNARYRLTYRGSRGGMFYCVDNTTCKRTSLQTTNKEEAQQTIEAKNQPERKPVLNLQIAKVYLAGTDNGIAKRSYRYAWAERAKMAGYPERFAQEALGHNSKAVHRAYAKRALMKIPSLEEYEIRATVTVEPAV